MKPLVTIVTATYKKFNDLPKTIMSVLKQDYENIEYIIADDGSENFPQAEIEKFLENHNANKSLKINIIHHHNNQGTVRNLNAALKQAKGEYYIALSCGDCFLQPNIVSKIISKHVECDEPILATRRLVCDLNYNPLYFLPHIGEEDILKGLDTKKKQYEAFIKGMYYDMASGSALCIRMSYMRSTNYYDTKYQLWEDGPLINKYLWMNRLIFSYDIVSIAYQEGGISSTMINPKLLNDKAIYMHNDQRAHYGEVSKQTKKYLDCSREFNQNTGKRIELFVKYLGVMFQIAIYRLRRTMNMYKDKRYIKTSIQKYKKQIAFFMDGKLCK